MEKDLTSLEEDELPRSLYVQVSTESLAEERCFSNPSETRGTRVKRTLVTRELLSLGEGNSPDHQLRPPNGRSVIKEVGVQRQPRSLLAAPMPPRSLHSPVLGTWEWFKLSPPEIERSSGGRTQLLALLIRPSWIFSVVLIRTKTRYSRHRDKKIRTFSLNFLLRGSQGSMVSNPKVEKKSGARIGSSLVLVQKKVFLLFSDIPFPDIKEMPNCFSRLPYFNQGFPIGLPCRNWIEVGLRLRLRLLLELAVGNFPQGFKIHLSGSFQAVRLALFSSFTSLRTDELLLIETRPSYLSSVQVWGKGRPLLLLLTKREQPALQANREPPARFESLRAGKQEEADRAKASPLLASALPEAVEVGTRSRRSRGSSCGFRVKLAHCQKANRSSYLDQRTLIPGRQQGLRVEGMNQVSWLRIGGMGVRSVPSSPSPRLRLLETGDRVFLRRLAASPFNKGFQWQQTAPQDEAKNGVGGLPVVRASKWLAGPRKHNERDDRSSTRPEIDVLLP
ncbi:unnamed protein product [Arabidopsis thaliana]|uniref:Uncharacterized protein n=4 Tax=Arabidopsis TaxID=3701 RepID=A0A654GF83_ARATH|nr:uncharacterized protein AT2G07706 [Arabidopsis thaliana]KAG7528834.1 hypothetical protein ISN44_Un155g000100 [Arabidopsis suecica]KAG7529288.1 hypothetical protein ISN45_Un97g000740 [Arabidopsis thaliana x Arabidopsis arenosa]AEC06094.1 hypothetical protein AT2G07706 [Arabidopsis thaliana]CAA0413936.1 unnamed protein product [Arabidopsis thaliana]VYS71818.1 unnamed protein product [Arabidopsis thaliana]|eukprot:NP_178792.3 hypothetical protein AT2G07706 [Arabidopsis thaliana]